MYEVFIEYKVYPEKRDAYLQWIRVKMERFPRFSLYEGVEQPSQFVEMWPLSQPELARMKEERTGAVPSEWSALNEFVVGGLERLHIWPFRRIT
jgi:hypothetical protein